MRRPPGSRRTRTGHAARRMARESRRAGSGREPRTCADRAAGADRSSPVHAWRRRPVRCQSGAATPTPNPTATPRHFTAGPTADAGRDTTRGRRRPPIADAVAHAAAKDDHAPHKTPSPPPSPPAGSLPRTQLPSTSGDAPVSSARPSGAACGHLRAHPARRAARTGDNPSRAARAAEASPNLSGVGSRTTAGASRRTPVTRLQRNVLCEVLAARGVAAMVGTG